MLCSILFSIIRIFSITKEHFKEDLRPTIGADFTTKQLFVEGTDVILEAWDTAGESDSDVCIVSFTQDNNCVASRSREVSISHESVLPRCRHVLPRI